MLGIEKRREELKIGIALEEDKELSELRQKLDALDNELETNSLSDQSDQSEEEQALNEFVGFLFLIKYVKSTKFGTLLLNLHPTEKSQKNSQNKL